MNHDPGREELKFAPSKVSWATVEFVRRPPALAATAYVYIAFGAFLTGLLYTCFAQIPVSINAGGVLVSEQSPIPVNSQVNAKVVKLWASENGKIERGQPILETDFQITNSEYAQIKREAEEINRIIELDKAGRCGKKCILRLGKLSRTSFDLNVKGSLKETLITHRDMVVQYYTDREAAMSGAATLSEQYRQIRVAQGKLNKIREKNAESLLKLQVEQLLTTIGNLQTQIAEKKQRLETTATLTRSRLETRLKTFVTSIEEFRSQQTIKSPITGYVVNLSVGATGQQISVGQKILDLIPADTNLVAELDIMNTDISEVEEGMEVLVKLDALSEREYGVLKGKVIDIPVKTRSADPANPGATPVYAVKVSLDKQQFEKSGNTYEFKLGMTLKAQLVTKRERLIVLGAKKILKITDEISGG